MSIPRALYHAAAALYWGLACPVRADASAVLRAALHRAAYRAEIAKC